MELQRPTWRGDPLLCASGAAGCAAPDATGSSGAWPRPPGCGDAHTSGGGAASGSGAAAAGIGGAVGSWQRAQLAAVFASIVAHVFVMAYTDPLQDPSFVMQLLMCNVQLSLLLAVLLSYFLLTASHGPYARLGLYHLYLRQHAAFYLWALAATAAFCGASGYRLMLAHAGASPALVWARPGFLPLWAASRGGLLLLQCGTAAGAARSLRPADTRLVAAAAAAGLGEGAGG
ncbi:MAG: hypothetical protein J3K34DRAFT_498860 [Monoraphidium minutum]|nr:MAG: hypothetical protein J3K34DRAFT_498860 [Monoraphidium minutum]